VAPHSNPPHALQPRPAPFDWGLAMGLGVPDFSARRFTTTPTSLKRIRRFTHRTLSLWGRRSCADDVITVVSELVTNAVCHALPTHSGHRHGWLGLMNTASTVVCAVQDPSPQKPLQLTATAHDTRGRGLLIIGELAHDWGYSLHGASGKTVWALVPTSVARFTPWTGAGCGSTTP